MFIFLEILENVEILESPQIVDSKGASSHFLQILEFLEMLEILEIPPFRKDPLFSVPKLWCLKPQLAVASGQTDCPSCIPNNPQPLN